MPSVRVRGSLISIATIIAAGALIVSLLANLSTAASARENCRRVDALYTRVRDNANRSFAELPQNAKLLGVKVTPELVEKARADRDRTLRAYAPITCSIWVWK